MIESLSIESAYIMIGFVASSIHVCVCFSINYISLRY
jgi:hypothetical protein